jgi:methylenetetrahydrofolate reductase (NADPH)
MVPKTFKVDIPQELTQEALKCQTDEAIESLGIEWCINQCRELMAYGVPSIHFYSVGAVESIKQVAKAIY